MASGRKELNDLEGIKPKTTRPYSRVVLVWLTRADCSRMLEDMILLITRILISALALLIVAYFLPGFTIDGLYTAIIGALILGLLNVLVRPVLIILTLPITLLTLGLFIFVINALLFLFVASFVEGFTVSGFWTAVIASIGVSIISAVGNRFVK
jgi:putative membrane protein